MKSATGNSGEFNPENPDIRFNVKSSDQWASSSADNNANDIIYKMANKQIDLQDRAGHQRRSAPLLTSTTRKAKTLYHGRAAEEKELLGLELTSADSPDAGLKVSIPKR